MFALPRACAGHGHGPHHAGPEVLEWGGFGEVRFALNVNAVGLEESLMWWGGRVDPASCNRRHVSSDWHGQGRRDSMMTSARYWYVVRNVELAWLLPVSFGC